MSAFNPEDWLARYEAAGGGWYVTDGKPRLLIAGQCHASRLVIELEASGCGRDVAAVMRARHWRSCGAEAEGTESTA